MSDALYHTGAGELWGAGTPIALLTDTVKAMLVDENTYAQDQSHDFVDESAADDLASAEPNGTGYAGGHGGSGRKALTGKSITVNKANGRSEFDAADITWEGIDVGVIGGLALVLERGANDLATRAISFHDTNFPVTTNGGDLTVQSPADLIRLTSGI
jgi:hypothetical protein